MRTGPELIRATRPFAEEDRGRTWRLLAVTLAALGAAHLVAILPMLPLWLRVVAAVLAGLTSVRFFIFYHDYLHAAIFRNSRVGHGFMVVAGYYFLAPIPVWRETHNYHHKNNAKLLGSAIGSYPTVTVGIWKGMNAKQRLAYRFARHPLTMLFGYFTVFIGGMCVSAFLRAPRKHWQGALALLVHLVVYVVLGVFVHWSSAVLGALVPLVVACALGSYLFYAQHNFPSANFRGRRDWDYVHAALRSSSMFDMPAVLHWFTGNIGYHHIHHLNHRIPFYRLPEAMDAVPELQAPGRTSWRPGDVLACLRLKLWDPERQRMVGFGEVA